MENSNGLPGAAETPADSARRIKQTAGEALERGKQAAGDAIERGKQAAASGIERGAGEVAGTAGAAAQALRRVADELESEHGWLGGALRKSASGLDRASHSLEGADLNSAARKISDFARREPALFLGASLALGFALARVGKTAVEEVVNATDGLDGGSRDIADSTTPMPGF